jgi:hypothetical protein
MIDMLKRHEIQVLRRAEHTWSEIAALSGVSEKTARRVAAEDPVTSVDNTAERSRRHVGRPSKAEAYRDVLVRALTEHPELRSVELLHRARQAGYAGGKSALYTLVQSLRVRTVTPLVRFKGLPGEFSQHDFGMEHHPEGRRRARAAGSHDSARPMPPCAAHNVETGEIRPLHGVPDPRSKPTTATCNAGRSRSTTRQISARSTPK